MAVKKYYAWTEIRSGEGVTKPGTVVAAKDFGDDWDSLVECGAVRTRVYPKMPETWKGSVRGYRMEQLRKIREDAGLEIEDLLEGEDDSEEDAKEDLVG